MHADLRLCWSHSTTSLEISCCGSTMCPFCFFSVLSMIYAVPVLLLAFVPAATGHGRLIDPPSRSSMWRYGFKNPRNYDDNALYCGGTHVSNLGCKDQESIQSSTTPDPGYQWESDKLTVRHHKREPRGQPFPFVFPFNILQDFTFYITKHIIHVPHA